MNKQKILLVSVLSLAFLFVASTVLATVTFTSTSATSDGALTLTGAAASTWSTSAGALTITSAAAATWSTSAGALSIDSAAALNLGNSTATSTSICNSATCDTITIGTNADADTITIGDSTDTTVSITDDNWSVTAAGVATFVNALVSPSATLGLDTGSAGALSLGNVTATSVSLCNSAACDTITIGSNADADTITIGDSTDTTVSITDDNWSITAAGLGTFVGVTSTGTVTLTGAEIAGASPLVFEGATADTFETTFAFTDPTADRTITFGNATGTVALSSDNLSVFAATTSAQLAGVISDETGTGLVVLQTSPTLVTPVLGVATGTSLATSAQNIFTAAAATAPVVARSATATDDDIRLLPQAGGAARFAGIITTADLTADRTYTFPNSTGTFTVTGDNLSVFAATTSAQFAGVISDETGTGLVVLQTSPTLVTPVLGVATGTSLATSAQNIFTAAGGTAPVVIRSATATDDDLRLLPFTTGAARFAGIITSADLTADRTYTLPDLTGTVALSANNLSVFAATTSAQLLGVLSDETGTGAAVFANTPTLVTPVLGAATATSINLGTTTITDHISATASIDIASIAAVTCNNTTITVTGAVTGDTVVLGPPSTIEANISWSGFVSAANTVSVRACNPTAGAIDPAAATWRADVWQH